jgi:metal-responsive CopG/Arc/MetJ family transcriptional regulator
MKTAISLPDPLFKAGEKAAKKLGLSRSQLYAQALRRYLESLGEESSSDLAAEESAAYGARRREDAGRVAAAVVKRSDEYRLDRAIAAFYDRNAPLVDPAGMAAQLKVLNKEDW